MKFEVEVTRIGFFNNLYYVEADNELEAKKMAIKEASEIPEQEDEVQFTIEECNCIDPEDDK